MLMETGEFVVNLPTEDLVRETDEAGVRSGRDINKWEKLHLHQEEGGENAFRSHDFRVPGKYGM